MLVQYEGYDPNDVDQRPTRLPEILKERIAHEVKLARIRAAYTYRDRASTSTSTATATAASAAANSITSGVADAEGSGGAAAKAGALPEHVRRQLAAFGSGASAAAIAASAASAGGMADVDEAQPVKALSFLEQAALRSRQNMAARKRAIVASSGAASNTASCGAGAGADGAGAGAGAGAGISGGNASAGGGLQRFPVHYKFQEGFTNAVRRPVRAEDWLGPPQ